MEDKPNPLWTVTGSVITALGAAVGFFGVQLWELGQKVAELTADQRSAAEAVRLEGERVDKLEERIANDSANIATLTSGITELDHRSDRVHADDQRADDRLEREIEEVRNKSK